MRRLGTYSRRNKLYYAFHELGRVVRTGFLLRYYHDEELRKTIHAVTNKSEGFHNFAKWIAFAKHGVIRTNLRHEPIKADTGVTPASVYALVRYGTCGSCFTTGDEPPRADPHAARGVGAAQGKAPGYES